MNQINFKGMKRKVLKAIAKGLIWMDNERNERITVNTLEGITAMIIVDIRFWLLVTRLNNN